MRALVLENELLRVGILLDRGSDVFEFLYKPRDLDFVWLTASGFHNPRHALAVAGGDPAAAFIDGYGGGWQEILPSGGAPSAHDGAAFAQHGEVSLLPWDCEVLDDDERCVAVRLTVGSLKTPLRLAKELRLASGSARLELAETLRNESDVDVPLMWGHHLAFGRPFLEPGARIALPDGVEGIPHTWPDGHRRIAERRFRWPNAASPAGDPVDLAVLPEQAPGEIVYLTGFPDDAWYELASRGATLRVGWDGRTMPYLWFWQELRGTRGYPWYARHWNIGLEPFTSYPTNGLAEAVANGTALTLGPRATRKFSLSAEVIA